jgi:hypothetical protein
MKVCQKKNFTEFEAMLTIYKAKHSKKIKRQEKRFYWCKKCKAYHLTSQEKRA